MQIYYFFSVVQKLAASFCIFACEIKFFWLVTTDSRATFGSKFGVILASVGSAVGLGNVWRFPYEAGANGGGAFLAVYLCCVFVLGIPMLLAEFYVGRATHRGAVGAFRKLTGNPFFSRLGYLGVLSSLFILGFYPVVAGWTFEYIWQSLTGNLTGLTSEEFSASFGAFSSSVWRPLLWVVAFLLLTHLIIAGGVQKGIERCSKMMMPVLFVMLVVLCIRSLMLSGAREGLEFLFKFNPSDIHPSVVLSAMGQAFFSLSLGAGCMITYASYFGQSTDLPRTAKVVALLDTLIAVLAGVVIFPAVFTFGIAPTQGPNLVFVTLPNIFSQLPMGNLWSLLFFVLLAIAALTSVISIHQVVTAYVEEEFRLSHAKSTTVVTVVAIVLSVFGSLSLGLLGNLTIGGMCLFDAMDYATAKILMPLGSMFISIFLGWKIGRTKLVDELTNGGTVRFRMAGLIAFVLKYVAPILIGLIFLSELGIIII